MLINLLHENPAKAHSLIYTEYKVHVYSYMYNSALTTPSWIFDKINYVFIRDRYVYVCIHVLVGNIISLC